MTEVVSREEAEAREAYARTDGFWNGVMAGVVVSGALAIITAVAW